jgi:SAM-dependent methyltransferase
MKQLRRRLSILKGRLRMSAGVHPISPTWGFDRGLPIHRYYLEKFLAENSSDIRGHCMEFQEDSYASRFGGKAVTRLDILNLDGSLPQTTLQADLTKPNTLPSDQFDCIICTHVLHLIPEVEKAIPELYRILKPNGALLVGGAQIGMCSRRVPEYYRFTAEGLRCLLERAFAPGHVVTRSYGNSLTGAGEIRGLASHEFSEQELNWNDDKFAVEVCARAVKSCGS